MHGRWAHMDEFDQDEWLEHLEEHLKEIVNISGKDVHTLAADIQFGAEEGEARQVGVGIRVGKGGGTWVCNEALYEWWKRKITEEVKAGGRYFSIMACSIFVLLIDP